MVEHSPGICQRGWQRRASRRARPRGVGGSRLGQAQSQLVFGKKASLFALEEGFGYWPMMATLWLGCNSR